MLHLVRWFLPCHLPLLQKAVQAGYKDAAQVARDKDLDALREREDFKKLVAELERE